MYRLHTGLAPGSHFWNQFGDAVGLCIALGFLHKQARHGYTTARAQITGRFVADAEANHASGADNIFVGAGVVGSLIGVLVELCFKSSDFVLQFNNVVAINFAPLRSVEIFADGTSLLAWATAG